MWHEITLWGNVNNLETPIIMLNKWKYHLYESAFSFEFISRDLVVRGMLNRLDIIDYMQAGEHQYPPINIGTIWNIHRLAKNMIATAGDNGTLSVLDPIARKCYFIFKNYNKMSSKRKDT